MQLVPVGPEWFSASRDKKNPAHFLLLTLNSRQSRRLPEEFPRQLAFRSRNRPESALNHNLSLTTNTRLDGLKENASNATVPKPGDSPITRPVRQKSPNLPARQKTSGEKTTGYACGHLRREKRIRERSPSYISASQDRSNEPSVQATTICGGCQFPPLEDYGWVQVHCFRSTFGRASRMVPLPFSR